MVRKRFLLSTCHSIFFAGHATIVLLSNTIIPRDGKGGNVSWQNRKIDWWSRQRPGVRMPSGSYMPNMHRIFTVLPTTISAPARRRRTQSRMLSAPPSRGLAPCAVSHPSRPGFFPSFPTPASTTLRRSKRGGLPPRSKKRAAWVKANALRSLCSPWSCGRPSMRSVMKSAASFCSLSSAVTKAMKLPKPSPARPVPFVQNSLVPLRSFA